MANITLLDASGATKTVATTITGGVDVPAHYATDPTGANAVEIAAHGNADAKTVSASLWSQLGAAINLAFNGTTLDRLRTVAVGDAAASTGILAVAKMLYNGATYDRIRTALDAMTTGVQASGQVAWNGASFDRVRVPNVFKTLSATVITTETTIWTPTTGKKFRLMGFMLAQGVATGAVTLKDNTGGSTIFVIPQETVGVAIVTNLGNGILSAAANNVLTATGASTETLTGTIWGTEE